MQRLRRRGGRRQYKMGIQRLLQARSGQGQAVEDDRRIAQRSVIQPGQCTRMAVFFTLFGQIDGHFALSWCATHRQIQRPRRSYRPEKEQEQAEQAGEEKTGA